MRALLLSSTSVSDISPLSGITSLAHLELQSNLITNISALGGLTSLEYLLLNNNVNLNNIQPLLDNTGLVGATDIVNFSGRNVSGPDVDALKAKLVTVTSDCP